MTDEPGVMGNLPRSRPGRRSDKRAAEVKPAKPKATAAAKAKKPAAKRATAARKTTTARRTPAAASKPKRPATTRARAKGPAATTPSVGIPTDDQAPRTAVRDERVETPPGTDPITAALRLGMSVGDAGLKVVAKLAQRLPRP